MLYHVVSCYQKIYINLHAVAHWPCNHSTSCPFLASKKWSGIRASSCRSAKWSGSGWKVAQPRNLESGLRKVRWERARSSLPLMSRISSTTAANFQNHWPGPSIISTINQVMQSVWKIIHIIIRIDSSSIIHGLHCSNFVIQLLHPNNTEHWPCRPWRYSPNVTEYFVVLEDKALHLKSDTTRDVEETEMDDSWPCNDHYYHEYHDWSYIEVEVYHGINSQTTL